MPTDSLRAEQRNCDSKMVVGGQEVVESGCYRASERRKSHSFGDSESEALRLPG